LEVLFFILVGVVSVQLIFCILFLVAFSQRQVVSQKPKHPVSIIVCAHDEEENLKELIPLLLSQDYHQFEVIVVNDRSNDNTFDWLIAETKKDHRLRMVHVNRLPDHVTGKKYAITLGVRAATFDWLLFTDADCRPSSNYWIKEMNARVDESTQFVLGFSPYKKSGGFLNLFIRFESLLTAIQYLSFGLLKVPYMGVGRNLAYRKSFFMEQKGFTDILHIEGGDDDLYVNRHATGSNTRVCLDPQARMVSIPEATFKDFARQKVRHLSVGKRYSFKHRAMLGIFMLAWLLTWFVAIPLLVTKTFLVWTTVLLALRWIMLIAVFANSTRRLGEKFEAWALPVLDFLFSIYYISTGLATLLIKKVRWKRK
jgi:glycosyltransferase involved in cell wall biosynthesis